MKKTYQGSCHCRLVRFEADMDLSKGTGKCNCSICSKSRFWSSMVKPDCFRLLEGKQALSDYQFNSKSTHHHFCKICGIKPFIEGYVEQIGGAFYSINLACLDNISAGELAELPVSFADGRNDNWWSVPDETRHL